MLTFNQLTFSINQKKLFADINISFLPSSIIYLQGSNGSGKTSLLRMIANIQQPTKGNILYRLSQLNNLKKPYCTYIGHNFALKSQISVLENLKFWATIYNAPETIDASIHYFKLYDLLDKKCYQLSVGNQKKISIAKLITCPSDLWLLDEVTSNLDQENKYLLHNLIIAKANSGGIIFITSHSDLEIKSAQILNLEDYLR